jgi:hypothetical protein
MTSDREQKGFHVFGVRKSGLQEGVCYREGRLFRFHKVHPAGEAPPNTHSMQHFWLYGKCSEEYTLVYEDARGVVVWDTERTCSDQMKRAGSLP